MFLSNFLLGNGLDYMNLALQDGGVALTVQLGTGKLDTQIKPKSVRFDDNAWHYVVVSRKSAEVRLQTPTQWSDNWRKKADFGKKIFLN
jgi:hypothetical protein